MLKTVLAIVLPLVTPFAGFFLWAFVAQQVARRRGRTPVARMDVPIGTLLVVGLVFMILTLLIYFFLFQTDRSPPGTPYVPAKAYDLKPNLWPSESSRPAGTTP